MSNLTVYKYPLPINDTVDIEMPQGAEILHVGAQGDGVYSVMLWAVVDPSRPLEPRRLYVRGTGHPFTGEEGAYLGTVLVRGGMLVWHVFEARG